MPQSLLDGWASHPLFPQPSNKLKQNYTRSIMYYSKSNYFHSYALPNMTHLALLFEEGQLMKYSINNSSITSVNSNSKMEQCYFSRISALPPLHYLVPTKNTDVDYFLKSIILFTQFRILRHINTTFPKSFLLKCSLTLSYARMQICPQQIHIISAIIYF